MHPSVQPPAITKSVVLLLCLRQSDLQTNASFQLYAWQHKEFYLGQLAETGKDALQKLGEGRSELEMNQTVSNEWFIGLHHWIGHFQNKEGTNAGGDASASLLHILLPPFEQVASYGNMKKSQRPQTEAATNVWRISPVLWERDFRLRGTDAAHWNQWEESNIFTSVCTNIDCRRLSVGMLDHVGWSSKELLSREHN